MSLSRLERADLPEETMLSVLAAFQATIWTAMPATVHSWNPATNTIEAQITIQAQITKPDDSTVWETLPMLVDVPVIFPCGGGFTLTFPLKAGDEVLINFSSRCLDAWWQSAGVQPQAEFRMHDLSDGFAIPGPRSLPSVISSISTDAVQLRSDDGTAFVEIQEDKTIRLKTPADLLAYVDGDVLVDAGGSVLVEAGGDLAATIAGTMDLTSTGDATVTAPNINLVGNVKCSGGTLTHNGVNVGSTHKHSGIAPGGSNTGNPV